MSLLQFNKLYRNVGTSYVCVSVILSRKNVQGRKKNLQANWRCQLNIKLEKWTELSWKRGGISGSEGEEGTEVCCYTVHESNLKKNSLRIAGKKHNKKNIVREYSKRLVIVSKGSDMKLYIVWLIINREWSPQNMRGIIYAGRNEFPVQGQHLAEGDEMMNMV